jgi:AAA15 family ATPase/GTPase
MLKKVRIKNFLSCEDTEFDLEQITVLIGRNAAGKTNILKVPFWISWSILLGNGEFFISLNKETEISLEFLINDNKFKYNIFHKIGFEFKEVLYIYKNDWIKIVERDTDKAVYYYEEEAIKFNVNGSIPVIKSIVTFFPEEKIDASIKDFYNYLNGINYYTLENIDRKDRVGIIASEYKRWLSTRDTKSLTDSPAMMRLLDSWIQDKELFEEISEIVGKNGLNLIGKIIVSENNFSDFVEYNPEHHWYFIKFSVGNLIVDYHQLSFGTQRVLMILLALLYDKSTTLLIEQPEDGIHLWLLRKVLSICSTYAKAYNKQLIITTHSPDVIDMFQAENIRLVKMTEAGTKVNKLDDELLAILPDYLENEGVLSDFIESMDDE